MRANPLFGSHPGGPGHERAVDLIQVARVGIQNKNAADIRGWRSTPWRPLIVAPGGQPCSSWSAGGRRLLAAGAAGCGEFGQVGRVGSRDPRRTASPQARLRCARSTSTGARLVGGGRAGRARPGGRPFDITEAEPAAGAGRWRNPAPRRLTAGRAEEQDAGRWTRRSTEHQLRSPELPRLPGPCCRRRVEILEAGGPEPDHQADRGNARKETRGRGTGEVLSGPAGEFPANPATETGIVTVAVA